MADLTIVIVSYNVRHFLLNCLDSIEKSNQQGFSLKVVVVDNASVDGSVAAVRQKFPKTTIIENKLNVGFAKANNQGFRLADGAFVLALNPDTILQEDTLTKCLAYMREHPECGVLGVKMIDGSGKYLPESKRGRPTLWNSFCKFSGLTALFPDSRMFSGYYLGHLKADEINEVEVLCGAFMFFRRDLLMQLGGFDEDYFMYGEDIDLSHKISQSGDRVVYFPLTRIIHFKGESSKKASFNYVINFYQSMSIYVGKHYHGIRGLVLKIMIRLAIFFTAMLSFFKHNLLGNLHLFIDFLLLTGMQSALKKAWANWYFHDPTYYQNSASLIHTLGSTFILVFSLWFFGQYDKNWRSRRQLAGIAVGTVVILVIYALLPAALRSSRMLILGGAVLSFPLTRLSLYLRTALAGHFPGKAYNHKYLIVGKEDNAKRITQDILSSDKNAEVLGTLYPGYEEVNHSFYINNTTNLKEITAMLKAGNIVFSTDDIAIQDIFDLMVQSDKEVRYLITGREAASVVSSGDKGQQGVFFHAESGFRLGQGLYLRVKRLTDIFLTLCFVSLSPVLFFSKAYRHIIWPALWQVLNGQKTWVSYGKTAPRDEQEIILPEIRNGVFDVAYLIRNSDYFPIITDMSAANVHYARHYTPLTDLTILSSKLY
ncbi:MAG: glycosyltransferase [Saprospiraceae bacterium]|nr:glycosyltransferase [Saprospiraceae bacterium]